MTTPEEHEEHEEHEEYEEYEEYDEYDELLARVGAATARVSAAPGAVEQVGHALGRRRRRRRTQVALASLAAATVLGGVGVAVIPNLVGDDDRVAPADEVTAPAIIGGGGYRPAGFFKDIVGGTAVPSIIRYYRTEPRVVFTARFDWSPDPAGVAYLGGLTLERYRTDAEQRCSTLVDGAATCDVRDDGTVLARYEIPADGAELAPISGEGRLRLDGSPAVLRGVTYFRSDTRAVTVLVCNCSNPDGTVESETSPVTFEALEDVVTDESWGLRVGG